jgi:hypothetical protein
LAQPAVTPDTAARQWLFYVDGSDYAKGWARAGNPFKTKMAAQVLQGKIAPVREPLGAVMQRKLSNMTFVSSAPGLPDGKYAVVQFRSSFANQVAANEIVWLDSENDRWMVIGYFIGPDSHKAQPKTGQDRNQASLTMYAVPAGKACSHNELVQARIAGMNGYTGGPNCANGP